MDLQQFRLNYLLYPFTFALLFCPTIAVSSNTLNVTAISAANNQSTLECWALLPGFSTTDQPGTAGSETISLGFLGGQNSTYSVLPSGFDGGRHNAPATQWVVFLSGLAHVTLPHSRDEAWIKGGKNGVILALDTADVSADGHNTTYPSREETIALQFPIADGVIPEHRVLHSGPCTSWEQEG